MLPKGALMVEVCIGTMALQNFNDMAAKPEIN